MGLCNSKRAFEGEAKSRPTSNDATSDSLSMHSQKDCYIYENQLPLPPPSPIHDRRRSPRAIFVSFYYLWLHWESIPSDILFNSIVCIHGRRSLLFPRYEETTAAKEWPLSRLNITPEFLDFIQCKDAQGLVLWLRQNEEEFVDEFQSTTGVSAISPLTMDKWDNVSQQLCSIIDRTTNNWYQSVTLSKEWWQTRDIAQLHYCNDVNQVCNELDSCDGNYKAMAELFKQSNPSLIPIIQFDTFDFNIEVIRFENTYAGIDPNVILSFMSHKSVTETYSRRILFQQTSNDDSDTEYDDINYSDFGDIPHENGFVWTDNYDKYLNE